ncbi:pseudouridine synthase [Punctularia strigosozonata HHB-11173 SS5]|uniref:pseudouridine synthase n=1 Tax=Punctularia strigosozonata (strain HHB-11173) TaxID=741275 RepID=UPI00044180BD|nr:pseudouridine synthase [Punctularia strigosozonata HHB-11173 SS5]EIN06416.1 pseudouridine synthase [Punctularia strigosozonata HHB-11173 SS5]
MYQPSDTPAASDQPQENVDSAFNPGANQVIGLKKIPPYWYPYTTMAKGRWLGREILEVVSTEFRDRSMEYYRYALESGVTTINGKVAKPDTIIQNGDRIENVVHRHEPPVTSSPVKILHHDVEREFIVIDKPGSIPVHPSGRYYKNSLIEILKDDFGYKDVYTVNRLDRLTSGLMIVPLSSSRARMVSDEFIEGKVQKEYVARVKGHFPPEEVICEEPLLTVDRQMGLNIVHPEGKPAKTIFTRMLYDKGTDTSVVHCRPLTGRSHQIRVHLQYLGHPIANDVIYSEERIWGAKLGKGGLDLTPSDERAAPKPPSHFTPEGNPESLTKTHNDADSDGTLKPKLLPRETGHDIGMGSPVPLSAEAVGVITRLRNMKDEDEDWSRWRDVVFRAKGALVPKHAPIPLPKSNRRKRGGPAEFIRVANAEETSQTQKRESQQPSEPPQLSTEEALAKITVTSATKELPTSNAIAASEEKTMHSESLLYCPDCYLPLHPDPKPEKLYIFLHALRYTTSLGSFETEMPVWAREGWKWDRS